ncbi:ImmA/IrrE family metallo-endopeptidase [Staphylococcus gallinarum]|uniref:ImmA/IrrE family metallo-endopeptidase n=1 Tax=Staphylococcus gallinarum TaxID=1293 RepID=UPI002442A413|nr:ImmA/IrrE family metallo-endopeptidase [Staphylococcus gallinarum]
MYRYEEMVMTFDGMDGIFIDDCKSLDGDFEGFYCNGTLLIDKNLSQERKLEVLAEEIAHHYFTYGDILNQRIFINRKFETYARRKAYEILIPLEKINTLYEFGIITVHEMAVHFEVTDEFIVGACNHYRLKKGVSLLPELEDIFF